MEMRFRFGLSDAKIIIHTCLIASIMLTATGSGGNLHIPPKKVQLDGNNIYSSNNIWSFGDVAQKAEFEKKQFPDQTDAVKESEFKKNQISDQINTIKKAFSLTKEEVSKILDVSRKTLYTWESNGLIPKDKKRYDFFILYILAKEWLELGYPTDRAIIFSENINGETIFSSLSKFNKDKTLFMGRYLFRKFDNSELI